MCTGYNATGASSADANGTWKPVERLTEEQRGMQIRQAAEAAPAATPGDPNLNNRSGSFSSPMMAAAAKEGMRTVMQNQQADRDAAHLAAWGAQGGKQARAPGKGSLITGGASNSVGLAARGTTAGTTLLGS